MNRLKHNEYARNYYWKNREKVIARQKAYAARPDVRERRRKYNEEYRKSRSGKRILRSYQVQRRFGLSPEDYRALWVKQKGRCEICRRGFVGRQPAVDHCHKTNRVRGLLCATCNGGIGMMKDSPTLLRAAARYLQTH